MLPPSANVRAAPLAQHMEACLLYSGLTCVMPVCMCGSKGLFTPPASTFPSELGYLAQVALGILLGFPDLLSPARARSRCEGCRADSCPALPRTNDSPDS